MSKLSTTVAAKAVLHVTVGESIAHNLARAQSAMEALQRGKPAKSHFGVGFAEVGQMLAVFTPKRWELIARLRETGPLTTAELARKLDRDYKNVHQDVAVLELAGLLVRDGRKLTAPWDELQVSVALA